MPHEALAVDRPGLTGEQRAVETLRDSDARYRRLFETAQDGILILDAATGQVVDANPFLKELLGYSQEEFLGRKLWEIGPFKGEDASKSAFAALQINDRLHYEALPLETKDGRRVEVEFISNAYLVDGTRLIQCNIRDITERMRVNQALEAANKELAFQVDEKGKRADELALINAERLAANEELAFQVEEKGKRADELALINAERSVANKELAFQVEEKGKRADELALINAELARSNAELEQFAYVATHDLQEPLRAVASCVQLLQRRYEEQLDARAQEFITHAVDGTKRMETLINDLLAFSRISTHARPFAPTSCETVLRQALANLKVAIEESGAVLTQDALPSVRGDATQLAQLFQNLVGNALKFRGDLPAKIHIGAVLAEGEWRFSVADNGIGMEPQYFERVFQVFQRLHTRKKYQGTGIGLAICKKVVERHGGRIWVESQPGQGAIFCFTIPEKEIAMDTPIADRPIVILLVEDNPTDVLITREGLLSAKLRNTLYVADDGVEAMEFLRREGRHAGAPRPDLILLDLNMPRMNGQEVLAAIKADDDLRKIPAVILTTSQSKEDVVKAYGLHANCYINKPVDFDDFVQVVQTIQDFWFSVVTLSPELKR